MTSFINKLDHTIQDCWSKPAISLYGQQPLSYGEYARAINELQYLWSEMGLQPGDKVCINARSSVNWMTVFMAAATGGYVSVQLFNGFTPADTAKLTDHSDSRILYTEKRTFSQMNLQEMPQLIAVFDCDTMELLASRSGANEQAGITEAHIAAWKTAFAAAHPHWNYADFHCADVPMDALCAIMYTSGSTGNPKGVMLSVKNFSANVELVEKVLPMKRGENHFSVLPYAHIFGLTVDAISSLCIGMHLCILGTLPMPNLLKEAFAALHPRIFFAVPLVLGKYTEYILGEDLRNANVREALEHYEDHPDVCQRLHDKLMAALGGNIEAFVTGGAAIPPEIENLLAFKLKTPFISGYGMTECAPVISVGPVGKYKAKSCGMIYDWYIQAKINSSDEQTIPGEVLVKGDVVFMGYYKNEEATREVLSADGWLHTGDVGVIDADRILFLSGRCKNMILTSNGQNIFPEEIEVVLNTLPLVAESIVVQREHVIHAIIVVNEAQVQAAGYDADTIQAIMRGNINRLNTLIPKYSAVSTFETRFEPFAKTPKGSVKRYLY